MILPASRVGRGEKEVIGVCIQGWPIITADPSPVNAPIRWIPTTIYRTMRIRAELSSESWAPITCLVTDGAALRIHKLSVTFTRAGQTDIDSARKSRFSRWNPKWCRTALRSKKFQLKNHLLVASSSQHRRTWSSVVSTKQRETRLLGVILLGTSEEGTTAAPEVREDLEQLSVGIYHHTPRSSQASAYPGAGRPYSLAVTRASPTRWRQRNSGRVSAWSLVAVIKYFSA